MGASQRIEVTQADITTLDVDAIVNAANSGLTRGGGVCGAIHAGAGILLGEACRQLGGCPAGEARITPGFDLPAVYVIHAVGPVWQGGGEGEPGLLAGAYASSLALAEEHGLRTVAFPAISTGIYGYPVEAATRIAVDTVREWIGDHELPETVVFCCFSDEDAQVYRSTLG